MVRLTALPVRARLLSPENTTGGATPPANQVAELPARTIRLRSTATAAFPEGASSPGTWGDAFLAVGIAASHILPEPDQAFPAKSARPSPCAGLPCEPKTAGTIRSTRVYRPRQPGLPAVHRPACPSDRW